MTIVCDIDNVLCDLQQVVVDLFNKRNGTEYTLDNFTDYNVENVLPIQEAVEMKKIYGEPELYKSIKPIVGAQDGLQKLVDNGHTVYLATDAIPSTYAEKVEWVNHFFPFVDNSHIIAIKHKDLLRCDVMIEDNLHNLLHGVHYERICMDYPWNRGVYDWVYDIHRCSNWDEIVDVVNEINERE